MYSSSPVCGLNLVCVRFKSIVCVKIIENMLYAMGGNSTANDDQENYDDYSDYDDYSQ